ncbi:MAG: M1 family metallopeptidase [Planctomycetota bacterium]|nr:M1 family metallopeptidase [Planctomycetota bacterium]
MIHRPLRFLTAALLLASGACHPALAQSDESLRFDAETGRGLANYLPHRDFDHTHMLLELDFPDFEHEARATARCTLTMTPIGTPRETVRLDATGYEIGGVSLDGRPLGFDYDGEELLVTLPRTIALGESVTLVIDYELSPTNIAPNGRALSWSPPTRRQRNPSEEVPMLHSQGQPDNASGWFPCYDHPLERLATELVVTVHEGFEVISNGELKSKELQDDGRVRWHWDQELPHAPYLVSLVIGKFDVVDVGGKDTARPGLTMPIYGPVGTGDRLEEVFANTPDMIAHFEQLFDEPYPWAKYSQAIVRDFAAGAMENTSATTFFPFAAAAEPGTLDDIIVHELVHQWFGDLVTNKSWAHLWLQEGWATFGEALWDEETARAEALEDGDTEDEAAAAARKAYIRSMRGNFRASAMGASRTSAPNDPALVSNLWNNPDLNFMKANNPYSRGACILHMLRERLGEEVFWRSIRLYLDRHRFGAVETSDFQHVLEEVSGEQLERFFDQWVFRAGAPKADVELDWQPAFAGDDDGPGVFTVTFRQVQKINADNPAYAMVVPVYCRYDNGSGEYVYIVTEEREATATARLDRKPDEVLIDPYFWNILDADITRDIDEPETVEDPSEQEDGQAEDAEAMGDHTTLE